MKVQVQATISRRLGVCNIILTNSFCAKGNVLIYIVLLAIKEKWGFAGDISICRWFALNLRLSCLLVVLVPTPFGFKTHRANSWKLTHIASNFSKAAAF